MINFIIYEDEKLFREKYIAAILKTIGNTKTAYKIHELVKYDKNTSNMIQQIVGKKVFILDIEVPGKSGLDFAREIRNSGDWKSPIIIVTMHEHLKNYAFTSKMLTLDFISKFYNCENNLIETLKISLDILESHKSLDFQYNGELYQIPYDDILFIEKNVEDLYSTIVTKNERIKIKKMIGAIGEELAKEESFFRTHRSCIININNLTSIELRECIMHFGDIETQLLSRDKKRELKILLGRKNPKSSKNKMEEAI